MAVASGIFRLESDQGPGTPLAGHGDLAASGGVEFGSKAGESEESSALF